MELIQDIIKPKREKGYMVWGPWLSFTYLLFFICWLELAIIYLNNICGGVCCFCRHCLMGDTKAVCIGQWWTGTGKGYLWLSSCAQERTRWWAPHKILWAGMAQGSTRTSHGPHCESSHKIITGRTYGRFRASPNGFYPQLPNELPLLGALWSLLLFLLWFFFVCVCEYKTASGVCVCGFSEFSSHEMRHWGVSSSSLSPPSS